MAVPLRILLILTLIPGIHSIKTVRQVSVKAGAPVTIPCLYEAKYRDNVKYLCKGYTWASCSYEIKTNTPQNSQIYSISDDKTQTIFTVTIKELADKNTYYWCIVEIDGGADVKEYFYLSETTGVYVDNQTVTGFIGENITINCHYTISGAMKWCKLNSNCVTGTSGSIDGTRVTLKDRADRFTVTLSELRPESSGWYYCVKGNFQMPVHLTVTEKPIEIYNINEVSNVSVKAGASVSVPCLYDSKYRNNVKYLCEAESRSSCSSATKKNVQEISQEYSFSEKNHQTIFIVTIKELIVKNTHYWCAVKTDKASDIGHLFHLSVTNSPPSLYVDNQEVTGFIGENITINCHYTTSGEMKWCKLNGTCVTGTSGSIDGTGVTLNTSINNVFSVTLSELRPESSGWYYCVKGDFQMPVHLTVTEKPTVVATTGTVTENGAFNTQEKTITHAGNEQNRLPPNLTSLIIPLSLLIVIVVVVLFIWFIIKHKQAPADSTTTESPEEEVTYSDVSFKKRKVAQGLNADMDENVTYSCVVRKQQSVKRSEDNVTDLTYSSLTF
ncbi:uncharacterized protein LOC108243399 isoform X1 [Kryptolebias marmoratus]|uniref:uncharacterized protein LOC108243399 isoform X1 n=1 Tax=Kryptolebias marmoratus TaxID=37003 RepID=UPI0007F92618|nr:uncharacterized protein LOC108243399 isoform X1 [Kryptolebias marmoratus]